MSNCPHPMWGRRVLLHQGYGQMGVVAGTSDSSLLSWSFEDLKEPQASVRDFASRQASFLQKVAARPR